MMAQDRLKAYEPEMMGGYRPQNIRMASYGQPLESDSVGMTTIAITVLFRWAALATGIAIYLEISGLMPLL